MIVTTIAGFATAHLANRKPPIYFKVVRILGLDVQVDVPDADQADFSNNDFGFHIPLETFCNSGTIQRDFVLNYKDGKVPGRASADRQLEFERAGAFEFDESRAVIYLTNAQIPARDLVRGSAD